MRRWATFCSHQDNSSSIAGFHAMSRRVCYTSHTTIIPTHSNQMCLPW